MKESSNIRLAYQQLTEQASMILFFSNLIQKQGSQTTKHEFFLYNNKYRSKHRTNTNHKTTDPMEL